MRGHSVVYKRIAIGLAVVGIIAVLGSLFAYGWRLHTQGLSSTSGDWGTFGDFVGGFAGTIISLATLVAIAVTLYLQAKELADTTDALKEQAKVTTEQLRLAREIELRRIRPIVTVGWGDQTGGGQPSGKVRQRKLWLELSNVGLGPAIIDKITVLEPGDEPRTITSETVELKPLWRDLIGASLPEGSGFSFSDWTLTVVLARTLFRGLAVGASQRIFTITFEDPAAGKLALRCLRERIHLVVHFRSLAGQELTTEDQYYIPPLLAIDDAR